MSETPPREHPSGQHEKLDLILWRLTQIETQLETKTVPRSEWETHHDHLATRVKELETDAETAKADRRKIIMGIAVALAVPIGKWSLDLISLTSLLH